MGAVILSFVAILRQRLVLLSSNRLIKHLDELSWSFPDLMWVLVCRSILVVPAA